jgi:hypothetical protein
VFLTFCSYSQTFKQYKKHEKQNRKMTKQNLDIWLKAYGYQYEIESWDLKKLEIKLIPFEGSYLLELSDKEILELSEKQQDSLVFYTWNEGIYSLIIPVVLKHGLKEELYFSVAPNGILAFRGSRKNNFIPCSDCIPIYYKDR